MAWGLARFFSLFCHGSILEETNIYFNTGTDFSGFVDGRGNRIKTSGPAKRRPG
jgi:hypothetical protein